MGRTPRERPARLAEKLVRIREALSLSQDGMLHRLGLEQQLTREEVSKYERGLRVPSLPTLLKYARTSGLVVDYLIDDEMDLPDTLPVINKVKSPRSSAGRGSSKHKF
jgi:transcriptional regulator with XRE-family HTH domain